MNMTACTGILWAIEPIIIFNLCFLRFPDDFSALTAMHKLNNKMIPNSQPPTKYRLNHTSLGGKQAMDRDYSLWIGDLSPDVDDYTLYKGFASRYPSVRLAKGMNSDKQRTFARSFLSYDR